jgi:hypothetical protein
LRVLARAPAADGRCCPRLMVRPTLNPNARSTQLPLTLPRPAKSERYGSAYGLTGFGITV